MYNAITTVITFLVNYLDGVTTGGSSYGVTLYRNETNRHEGHPGRFCKAKRIFPTVCYRRLIEGIVVVKCLLVYPTQPKAEALVRS